LSVLPSPVLQKLLLLLLFYFSLIHRFCLHFFVETWEIQAGTILVIANLKLFQATFNLTNFKQNFLFVTFCLCWMTRKSSFLWNSLFFVIDITVSKFLAIRSVWKATKMFFNLTKLKGEIYTNIHMSINEKKWTSPLMFLI